MVEKLVLNLYSKDELFSKYEKSHNHHILNKNGFNQLGVENANFRNIDIYEIYDVFKGEVIPKVTYNSHPAAIVLEENNKELEKILDNSRTKIIFNEFMHFSAMYGLNFSNNRGTIFSLSYNSVSGVVQKNTLTDNTQILWSNKKNK